jgi:hypothetical protein
LSTRTPAARVISETPGAKTTVIFEGIKVTATKDRLWHVDAGPGPASAEFLDQTLDLLLPLLSRERLDDLLIRLLMAKAAKHPR